MPDSILQTRLPHRPRHPGIIAEIPISLDTDVTANRFTSTALSISTTAAMSIFREVAHNPLETFGKLHSRMGHATAIGPFFSVLESRAVVTRFLYSCPW